MIQLSGAPPGPHPQIDHWRGWLGSGLIALLALAGASLPVQADTAPQEPPVAALARSTLPPTAAGARAAPAADPAGLVTDLVTQALKSLDDKHLSEEERAQRFRELLDRDFDMPRIGRFVLGRHWNEANDQDKQQFLKLFEEYVVRSYAKRFSEYSGEAMKITGSRPESEVSTLIQSQIVRPSGAPPAKVDWRVRKVESGFKVVDVDVEGVSMVLTQREEFSSVIQRSGGIVGLNKTLQDKLAGGDASLAAPIPPKNQ